MFAGELHRDKVGFGEGSAKNLSWKKRSFLGNIFVKHVLKHFKNEILLIYNKRFITVNRVIFLSMLDLFNNIYIFY